MLNRMNLRCCKLLEWNLMFIKPITLKVFLRKIFKLQYFRFKTGSSYEKFDLTPLVAMETFSDLRNAMTTYDLLDLLNEAFNDADNALINLHKSPINLVVADQVHRAAGAIAMIGAVRLHSLLCELEDAARAGRSHAIGLLLDDAMVTKLETEIWFKSNISFA